MPCLCVSSEESTICSSLQAHTHRERQRERSMVWNTRLLTMSFSLFLSAVLVPENLNPSARDIPKRVVKPVGDLCLRKQTRKKNKHRCIERQPEFFISVSSNVRGRKKKRTLEIKKYISSLLLFFSLSQQKERGKRHLMEGTMGSDSTYESALKTHTFFFLSL